MSEGLGPLVIESDALAVAVGPGAMCRMEQDGLYLQEAEGTSVDVVRWHDIDRIEIEVPTSPRWLVPISAILALLSPPGTVRPPTTHVRVFRRDGERREYFLGRPLNAPFDFREHELVDCLIDNLSESGHLERLADARLVGEVLPALRQRRSIITSLAWKRARQYLHSLSW
jgi:hypothetical protein